MSVFLKMLCPQGPHPWLPRLALGGPSGGRRRDEPRPSAVNSRAVSEGARDLKPPRVAPSSLTPSSPILTNTWLVRARFCVGVCHQGTGVSGFAGHGFTEPQPRCWLFPLPRPSCPCLRSRPCVIPHVLQPLAELAQGENELRFCQARPKLIPVPSLASPIALMSLVRGR